MSGVVTRGGRIRRAAFFMLLALAAEALSVHWHHPLSFYLFVAVGGVLSLLAVVSFLMSWISPHSKPESWGSVTSIDDSKEAANG